MGPEEWLRFNSADHQTYNIWQSNKLHILASRFADKTNPDVIGFINAFKERYKEIPDEYAFKGYDQVLFIGLSLATFGPEFTQQIVEKKFDVMDGSFDFSRETVIENHFVQVLQMVNYQFVKRDF